MVSDRFVGYWIAMQKISVFLIVGNTVIDFNNFKKVWSTGFHWKKKRKKRQQIFLSLTITVVIYIFCMYDNVWCIYGLWNNLILFSNNPFTRIDFFLFKNKVGNVFVERWFLVLACKYVRLNLLHEFRCWGCHILQKFLFLKTCRIRFSTDWVFSWEQYRCRQQTKPSSTFNNQNI